MRDLPGFWLAASGVASLVALVALLAVLSIETRGPGVVDDAMLTAPQFDRLLGREARSVPLTVEQEGKSVPTEEVPSADPRVRIYRML